MTKEEKTRRRGAAAIAKDVLKWLDAGKMKATTGTYLSYTSEVLDKLCTVKNKIVGGNGKVAARTLLNTRGCQVCALGACFLSTVARYDAFQFRGPNVNDYQMRSRLAEYFSDEQQRLIESAFETCNFTHDLPGNAPSVQAAIAFGKRYKTDKDRLRAIMRNIIQHDGEFVPPTPRTPKQTQPEEVNA